VRRSRGGEGRQGWGTHQAVDGAQALLDAVEVLRRHEVRLVEQQAVGERHLLHRLVLHPLRLLLVQVLLDVLGIHQRDDAVQPREPLHVVVNEEGLRGSVHSSSREILLAVRSSTKL
jgi:hypothetical protein